MPTRKDLKDQVDKSGDLLELTQLLVDQYILENLHSHRDALSQAEYASYMDAARGDRFGAEVRALLGAGASSGRPASSLLTQKQWRRLQQATQEALDKETRLVGPVAAELLQSIDETLQQKVWLLFEAKQRSTPLKPGELFPIATHNLKDMFPRVVKGKKVSFTTHPANRNLDLGKLRYLGVMPPSFATQYEVSFNYNAGAALSTFLDTPIVGALVPNLDFGTEFDIHKSLEPDRFFDVKPREAETTQRKRILEMLERAEQAGVSVALLPELSVTSELSKTLGEWFKKRLGSPLSTLVAGSFHDSDGGRKVNRSQAYIASPGPPLLHDKFNPYELPEDGHRYLEDISPGPVRLTVNWSRGWSFTTLICKDFIEGTAQKLLSALRVNIVFLVSFSSETGGFKLSAGTLISEGQTMTFGVNFGGAPRSECAAALAALPLKLQPDSIIEFQTRQLGQPRLLVLRLKEFMDGWTPA